MQRFSCSDGQILGGKYEYDTDTTKNCVHVHVYVRKKKAEINSYDIIRY